LGVLSVSAWAFAASYGVFSLLKVLVGIRVSVEDEIEGLDVSEHGMTAYDDLEDNPLKTLSHTPSDDRLALIRQHSSE
jgi:ammonium transporter, Amt family